jgi:hypothetical protein
MSSNEIRKIMENLDRVMNEDSSGVERMVAQFKADARDHAKSIQQNGYRYSDSDYMEFFDDYSDLEELRDALQDYQTILQYVPSVDDDEATIKASIDKLAGMN